MAMLIIIQLFVIFCLFSHPWLLSRLGFPLTLQIQDKPKNNKNKVSFGSL